MRRRMALSTNGFSADFKSGSYGGAAGFEAPNLQAVTLGT
jgi:hypothetical protein